MLNTPELRALWEKELGAMRERIKAMRKALADGVQKPPVGEPRAQ